MNKQNERYYEGMLRMMREEDKKQYMENQVNRSIWVTFKKEGIHKYPAALDDPKLATGDWDDVSFLGYPHRHIFHFRVRIGVYHNDRDIEFIQFKRWLERLYSGAGTDNGTNNQGSKGQSSTDSEVLLLDYKSCEMIADELYEKINAKYPGRFVEIEVSEDGENGCVISYPSNKV
jgi:hypothetical protein